MGWWTISDVGGGIDWAGKRGPHYNGDTVADSMGECLDRLAEGKPVQETVDHMVQEVTAAYQQAFDRLPCQEEWLAALTFASMGNPDPTILAELVRRELVTDPTH